MAAPLARDTIRASLRSCRALGTSNHWQAILVLLAVPIRGFITSKARQTRAVYARHLAGQSLFQPWVTFILIILQLEIETGSELTEEFLQDELHPKKNLHRPAFAKPKGPPNRGAKRLTKPQVPTQDE